MSGLVSAATELIVYTPVRSIDATKPVQRKNPDEESTKQETSQEFPSLVKQDNNSATFQSQANLFNSFHTEYEDQSHANNNFKNKGSLSAFASASSVYDDAQFHTDKMAGTLAFASVGSTIDLIG